MATPAVLGASLACSPTSAPMGIDNDSSSVSPTPTSTVTTSPTMSSPPSPSLPEPRSHPQLEQQAQPESKSQPRSQAQERSTPRPTSVQPPAPPAPDRAALRFAARALLYFAYDGVPPNSAARDIARVAKAFCDLGLDFALPAPSRSVMSLSRKVTELLLAPTLSTVVRTIAGNCGVDLMASMSTVFSFIWPSSSSSGSGQHASLHKSALDTQHGSQQHQNHSYQPYQELQHQQLPKYHPPRRRPWWVIACALSLHRLARQALIYRLFFRLGSPQYVALSLLGIICSFFHASVFGEIIYIPRWPRHLAPQQGMSAVVRTALFSAVFALPLHHLSPALARRRGSLKKIFFALALAVVRLLSGLRTLLLPRPPSVLSAKAA